MAQVCSHIDILPCAGLANRMRAIASAMSAAQELMVKPSLTIYWKQEYWCGAAFRELFDMAALPAWIQVAEMEPGAPEPFQTEVNSEAAWAALSAEPAPVLRFKSYFAFYDARAETWPSMCPAAPGPPVPTERWLANLRALRFRPELVAAAKGALRGLQAPVGVHLRRQDHVHSINDCPASVMWAAMEKEECIWFFFTSDSMEDRAKAAHKFPSRIRLSVDPYKGRNTTAAMQGAAVDFISLSLCSKVLGSTRSSFSELAAAYGAIPFVPVRK